MKSEGVTLDTVSIKITSSSENAQKDIEKLSVSLNNLRSAIKGGFNGLNKLATSLETLSASSKNMGEISTNISKLENITLTLKELSEIPTPTGFKAIVKGLEDLKNATNGLGDFDKKLGVLPEVSTNLKTLADIPKGTGIGTLSRNLSELAEVSPKLEGISEKLKTIPSMVEPLKSLQGISIGKGFGNAISNLERLPEAMNKFDSSTLENVARVSNQLSDALTPVANKFRDIAEGGSKLSEMANKYGIGITKIRDKSQTTISVLSTLKKALTNINKGILNFGKGAVISVGGQVARSFQKAASKAKQLTLALIGTRTIFTLTRKAVSEYLALDKELSDFSTNVWRALGAQLAPAIEYAMELFKQFVRVIYSFVYAITGVDLIARANAKAMATWSKSAKDALGNLQKFDDLNVVEFPKSAGEGPDLIDMDKIDLTPIQWIIDAVLKIKAAFREAFDTGEWSGVGKEIANLINDATDRWLLVSDKVFDKIKTLASNLTAVVNGFFKNIDAADLAKTLEDALLVIPTFINTIWDELDFTQIGVKLDEFLQNFDFEKVITTIGERVVLVIEGIQESLRNIDTETLSKSLEGILLGIIRSVKNIIRAIDFKELSKKIREVILGMDWKTIISETFETIKGLLAGLGQSIAILLFGKEFKSDSLAAFEALGLLLGGVILAAFKNYIGLGISTLVKKLLKLPDLKKLSDSTTGSTKLTVPKPSTILKGLADLAIIIGGVLVVVEAFGWLSNIPGIEENTKKGTALLKDLFGGIGEIIIPLAAFSAEAVVLGAIGIKTVLSGLLGMASIIAGTTGLVWAIGALLSDPETSAFVSGGVEILKTVFNGLWEIALPLGVFSAYILALGFATPLPVLSGLGGFALIVGGLIVLLKKLGELKQVENFEWIIGEGSKVLSTLGETLGSFAGSIVKGFLEKSFEGLESVGTSLSNFMTNAKPFFEGLSAIDESTAKSAKAMASAILELTVAGLVEGVSRFLGIGDSSIETFGKQLPGFGKKLKEYADAVSGLDAGVVENSANAAKAITSFAKEIPNQGGLWSWIAGDNTLDMFGKQLPGFGKHLMDYYKSVRGIDSDIVTKSTDAAKSLTAFADEIPNQGGLVSLFTGDNTLEKFGKGLKNFGTYFKDYYNTIKGISIGTINTFTDSLKNIIDQYKRVKDNGLSATAKDFASSLKKSSSDLNSFFTNTLSYNSGWSIGNSFGKGIGSGIAYALKYNTSYPTLNVKNTSNNSNVGSYRISAYATGGFPDKGQYFYARENGIPELVGTMGGQTAVANNTQIIAGIKQGVKEAIIESDFNFTNVVNVGNETLYKKQQSYNKLQNNKYGTINV